MFVKYWMSEELITVGPQTSVSVAIDLMNKNDIHRIPVLEDGELVGMVTRGIIMENSPSKATSLSVFEINYLMNSMKCGDIMIKEPVTCEPEMFLEDAAYLILDKKVGCLPVMKDDKLVGIITSKDIFKAFIDMLGYYEEGCKVIVEVDEDKVGILASISRILADHQISISHLAVYHQDAVYVVINVFDKDIEKVITVLKDGGYNVASSKTTNFIYK